MENVCVRLDSGLSRQIEKDMKEFKYSTVSEFFRDAVRSKLKELEKERREKKAWESLYAARGILKGKVKPMTDEEWYKWRKENGKKFAKELADKYGWKL